MSHVCSILPLEPGPHAKFWAAVSRCGVWRFHGEIDHCVMVTQATSLHWLRTIIISSCNLHVNQLPCVSFSQSGVVFVPKCPHVWWQRPFPGVSHVRLQLFRAELVVICLVWGSYLAYVPECLLSGVSGSESCMKPWINTYHLCVIDV